MAKSIAIMQPYFFPYLGYFQLLNAVEEFVFYEDAKYIKQGWINRNRLLVNGRALYFTVPIKNQSSNSYIRETKIDIPEYERWKKKLKKTINQNYSSFDFFQTVYVMFENLLESKHSTIASLSISSVLEIKKMLKIGTRTSSSLDYHVDEGLRREDVLYEICKSAKADSYMNLPGGKTLYDYRDFKRRGVDLNFLNPRLAFLKREAELSTLHILFKYGPEQVSKWLKGFECGRE